jgi:hypothetical protein
MLCWALSVHTVVWSEHMIVWICAGLALLCVGWAGQGWDDLVWPWAWVATVWLTMCWAVHEQVQK